MSQDNHQNPEQEQPTGATIPERHIAFRTVLMLLFRLTDPKNFKWIALVVVVFLIPADGRREVFLALQNAYLIITVLVAIVVVMAVAWYYTRKLDKMEIERLTHERDELQRKFGSSTQSSEEAQL